MMIKKVVRYKKLLALTTVITCVIIVLNTGMFPDMYFISLTPENVSSCYYELSVKIPFVSEGFNPPAKSIYFHETSCRGGLNSRQACAVEAATRTHATWDIHVLFLSPVTNLDSTSFQALNQFEKVKYARINLTDYANRTPVQMLVHSGALNKSKWRVSHTSDVLRYLTLYKWGGIYLDLDTVVTKPLDGLKKNWSARESDENVAAGAMAFSRDNVGRMFAEATINDLAVNFRGDVWAHNGPGVITRVLKEKCGTQKLVEMSSDICQGFEVYGPELFYPISYKEADRYFKPGEISEKPYVYHVWNKITQHTEVANTSMYAKLAREYCPTVYASYGENFGS